MRRREDITPAIAARMEGDKGIFHKCGFIGLQDTLWDGHGRHLFTQCYIEGVIDVISGFGQSIYKVNFYVKFSFTSHAFHTFKWMSQLIRMLK